ncbi:MAG TPA: recombinase [Planctomycetales bacterium]|jgi:plasmid stabilization system protein ParE|nr:recombinase [Planctomycetales bacterium]
MTHRVILRRAAQAEYDAAGDWYEQQRPGLGVAFTAAVQEVFDRIAAHPRMHGIVLRDMRKAVVQGFPYCVYYRERPPAVVVLSVFHTSRDPTVWQSRA